MNRLDERVSRAEPIRSRPLGQRLADYARRHGLEFADEPTRFVLSWGKRATRHFIEIDKRTFAIRSGTLISGAPVYQSPPAYVGSAPLEELLDARRGDYDGGVR